MAESSENPGSIIIGEGVQAKGTFKVPGRAVINGTLEGELVAKDIIVGPTGKGVGKFQAEMADIRGEIHDTLVASGSLVIRATGKLTGEVFYKEMEIEKGGEVQGKMTQNGGQPAAAGSASSGTTKG